MNSFKDRMQATHEATKPEYPVYAANGQELYAKGYRRIVHDQSGYSYAIPEVDATHTHWGSGLYPLNADGTLGQIIHFNYDSSD